MNDHPEDEHQRSSEEMEQHDFVAAKLALQILLVRIGSWTNARWDQHLRSELGDEVADRAIRWIERTIDPKELGGVRMSEFEDFKRRALGRDEQVQTAEEVGECAPNGVLMRIMVCRSCMRVQGAAPNQKYCGDGGDKDFGHQWVEHHTRRSARIVDGKLEKL